jgi:tRNA (cytosine38-C5)-methyltransferase
MEPTSNNDDVITYIEFYSGVGGWSMALNDAFSRSIKFQNNNKRLKRLAALDHSDLCIRVFEHNFGPAMDTKSNKTFVIEKLTLKQVEDWAATIYVMSPPCQPHTRQHSNQDQDLKDPRSASFLHICSLLETMKDKCLPSYIFLENVIGFETSNSFERWRDVLRKRGYFVGHFHLTPTQGSILSQAISRLCLKF